MKLITAFIKPFKLEQAQTALGKIGLGATAVEVKGFGRQKGHTELYRGAEYTIEFLPKVGLEVAVEDGMVQQVLDLLAQQCRTGRIGDGKIFISELDNAVRIRTGENGEDAL